MKNPLISLLEQWNMQPLDAKITIIFTISFALIALYFAIEFPDVRF
jgi:hypothetical protein